MPTKILIIRLSSIGDIIQCMGVIGALRAKFPDAELHWVARSDMEQTLSIDRRIDRVWSFDKKGGFAGLIRLARELKREKFDYVYDAHSNIRSNVIKLWMRLSLGHKPRFALRSKERFNRFLLFRLGINRFDKPFVGVDSFRKPLKKWGVETFDDSFDDWYFDSAIVSKFENLITPQTVTLVPSANWEMKRWPVSHWRRLVELLPDYHFVVLGGPSDSFCADICSVAPERTTNMAGKSSIMESSYIVSQSNVVVSGDTGFLHSADMFRVPTLALMGPTAFGFPYRKSSEIVELDLKCRPCSKDGRGGCKQSVYQCCMVDITPEMVAVRVCRLMSQNKK